MLPHRWLWFYPGDRQPEGDRKPRSKVKKEAIHYPPDPLAILGLCNFTARLSCVLQRWAEGDSGRAKRRILPSEEHVTPCEHQDEEGNH